MSLPDDPRRTLAEDLRLRIADEIVQGTLVPGAALDETELAHRFEVSRTPVREAIRQLAASGLIDTKPHRGAVVARPTEAEIAGMFEAMADLEALCAARAAERMTGSERRALEAVQEELRALVHLGDPHQFLEADERLHDAIHAGAHNDYLADLTRATRARLQPFRHAPAREVGRLAASHGEHERVVVAIVRGDRDGAAAAMRDHVLIVRDDYGVYVAALPAAERPAPAP
ncbi:Putative regulator PutR for proline utilization protein [Rhodovulum sp. PH10]|uniref:GntR family transcriptional regulator n=1 Tax=Rhodovulum sp. PH10 TaxID=1187851 RepID=UPI00027C1DC3|nr:GntR family transcriptional regulator [Rhodovulum sp. PH10]EJW12894.1 Putative regulator PutR for proline utilization protein [Rhodovulum sp. PH10]